MGLETRRRSGFLRHPFRAWGMACGSGFQGRWGSGRGGVTGWCISTTAWYAAVRGLPRFRDLSDRILIHHSTLSQSRNGCSMSLAKFILSQNVRRVRVCKRHSHPRPEPQSPGRRCALFMAGARVLGWSSFGSLRWILAVSFRGSALDFIPDFPDHAAELTGDGYLDLVVMHEAFAQTTRSQVEAVLRFPGYFFDPAR